MCIYCLLRGLSTIARTCYLMLLYNSISSFFHCCHASLCYLSHSFFFFLNPSKCLSWDYISKNRSGLMLILVSIRILVDGLLCVIIVIQCFKISRWYSLMNHEISLVDCMTSISFIS